MPRKIDIVQELYIKRGKALALETRAATEFPEKAELLMDEVRQLRLEAKELEVQARKEKKTVEKELRDAALSYAVAREKFMKLHLGFNAHEVGIKLREGNRVGAGHTLAALTAVLELPEAEAPTRIVSDVQVQHEERVKNERKGLGYYTSAELARKAENPISYEGGGGAKIGKGVTTEAGT